MGNKQCVKKNIGFTLYRCRRWHSQILHSLTQLFASEPMAFYAEKSASFNITIKNKFWIPADDHYFWVAPRCCQSTVQANLIYFRNQLFASQWMSRDSFGLSWIYQTSSWIKFWYRHFTLCVWCTWVGVRREWKYDGVSACRLLMA